MRVISTKSPKGKQYKRQQERNAKRSAAIVAAVDGGKSIIDVANAYGISHQRCSFIVKRERNRRKE
jgi:aryl-alcohol dehydrogenase-like predicted oxidoreductase